MIDVFVDVIKFIFVFYGVVILLMMVFFVMIGV